MFEKIKIVVFLSIVFIGDSMFAQDYNLAYIGPLSGDFGESGSRVLRGVQLALEEYNLLPDVEKIGLLVKDTKDDKESIKQALNEIILEKSVIGIIGPILNSYSLEAAEIIENAKISAISPTVQLAEFTNNRAYVFRNSLTPECEGKLIADYAVKTLGVKKVAVISPDDFLGKRLTQAFINETINLDIEYSQVETYEQGTTDFREQILVIGGIDPKIMKSEADKERNIIQGKVEEATKNILSILDIKDKPIQVLLANFVGTGDDIGDLHRNIFSKFRYMLGREKTIDLVEDNNKNSEFIISGEVFEDTQTTKGNDVPISMNFSLKISVINVSSGKTKDLKFKLFERKPKQVVNEKSVEAIYIPAKAEDVILILPQLVFFDMKLIFLGCSRWYDKIALKQISDILERSTFSLSFFENSESENVKKFVKMFIKKYAYEPDSLSAYGYDTAGIFIKCFAEGNREKELIRNAICNIKDFGGITGITSYTGNGELQRQITILTFQNSEFKQLQ
ncbi:MAG: penicillin-binding protein activator [Candidatus Firestonebacteria bacterium]